MKNTTVSIFICFLSLFFDKLFAQTHRKEIFLKSQISVPKCDSIVKSFKDNYSNILINRNKSLLRKVNLFEKEVNLYIIESYVIDVGNYYIDFVIIKENKLVVKSYNRKKKRFIKSKPSSIFSVMSVDNFQKYINMREVKPCEITSLNGKISQISHFYNDKYNSFIHF